MKTVGCVHCAFFPLSLFVLEELGKYASGPISAPLPDAAFAKTYISNVLYAVYLLPTRLLLYARVESLTAGSISWTSLRFNGDSNTIGLSLAPVYRPSVVGPASVRKKEPSSARAGSARPPSRRITRRKKLRRRRKRQRSPRTTLSVMREWTPLQRVGVVSRRLSRHLLWPVLRRRIFARSNNFPRNPSPWRSLLRRTLPRITAALRVLARTSAPKSVVFLRLEWRALSRASVQKYFARSPYHT